MNPERIFECYVEAGYVFRDNEVGGYRIFGGCLRVASGCAHGYQI